MCRGSVLRYKSKVRLWEKQVSILTLPSLKPPLLGWNLGKTPFGMTGRRPLGRRKVLEGAADAQGWGRAGRAELPCPACPALSVCAPGARNSLRYSRKGEQLCIGIWVRRAQRTGIIQPRPLAVQQEHGALLRAHPETAWSLGPLEGSTSILIV